MSYKFFSSSKRKRAYDCSVRSIMASEGISWEEAYTALCQTGMKEQRMPSEIEVIGKTLEQYGYIAEKAPMVKCGNRNRRLTVREIARRNKNSTLILSVTGHVVCVKNGDWLDTWDSGDCKVFKIFRKTNTIFNYEKD